MTECLQKKLSELEQHLKRLPLFKWRKDHKKLLDEMQEAVRDIASSIEKRIDKLFQERDKLSATWLHKRAIFNAKILELEWTHTLITGKTYKGLLVGSSPSPTEESS